MEAYRPFGMEEIHCHDFEKPIECKGDSIKNPLETEVGGEHYKSEYQPIELMERVKMYACCSYIFKYVFRHKNKGKKQDLEKALHCCELMEALGMNWYQGNGRIGEYDTSYEEFYKFIEANRQLDSNQIRSILAIANKYMKSLKMSINNEIKEFYL